MAPKLNIISAVYTSMLDTTASGEKGMDVTDIVRKMVDAESQSVTFEKDAKFNDMFGDPEPFHPKQLKILYSIDGVVMKPAKLLEKTPPFSKGPRVIPEPEAKPTDLTDVPELKIVSGKWGSGETTTDVKTQLQEFVKDNQFVLKRSESLSKLFGDPAIGKPKELEITYLMGSEGKTVVVPEKRKTDIILGA